MSGTATTGLLPFRSATPDTFIGFGSVDPWMGKLAVKEVERAHKELGLKGIKFIPMTQEFYPNERRFYPIYEKIAELGMIAMFHTGTTGVGAGVAGGRGCSPQIHQAHSLHR